MADLTRFKTAQADPYAGFEAASQELQSGRKQGHWIWYIFPQLAGLGSSAMSERFGVQDVEEAVAYLDDPLLRRRLLAVTAIVARHMGQPGARLASLMNSAIDARKVVSSMTLFREVARRAQAGPSRSEYSELEASAEVILTRAAEEGISPCQFTLTRMGTV